MSRLDVQQQERDSCWQGDVPQRFNGGGVQLAESANNEGVEESGLEQSGVEQKRSIAEQSRVERSGAERRRAKRRRVARGGMLFNRKRDAGRKKNGHAHDISRQCEGRECKRKLECKWIDKTQQEFRIMQKVLGGYEEENGDERVGEIESF